MVRQAPTQYSLNGGEVSPLLYGRPDLAKFQTSLATCANFIPLPQGGITRRPGTRYIAEVKDSAVKPKLISFIFSRQQAYILEFGDEYVRFYMNSGQLYSTTPNYTLLTEGGDTLVTEGFDTLVTEQTDPTAAPYEVASPYAASELRDLQYAQTADVMYITHPNHPPRTLTRTGHTSWTFAELDFRNGPFRYQNTDDSHTMTASAVTGSITLTSSEAFFDAGHVGALFRLDEEDSDDYNMWEPEKTYSSVGEEARWDENVYELVEKGSGNKTGNVAPVHLEGDRWDGNKGNNYRWRYLHSGYGVVVITGVSSSTSASATVLNTLPSNVVSGTTKNWREGAWSDYRGWPRAVTLFEQRAWYAATAADPQTLYSSVSGDFLNFEPGALADDAIVWTINSKTANPISTLVDAPNLLILCQDRELVARSSQTGAAVKPDDFTVRPATSYGSAPVPPMTIDSAAILVDASGRRLIEMTYDLTQDNFVPFDLTIYAEHIARPGQ